MWLWADYRLLDDDRAVSIKVSDKRPEVHMSKKRAAVVVGYHTYDVCALQEMFEGFEDLHCYVQHLEQFTSSTEDIRDSYDAVIFYTMEHRTPDEDRPWYEGNVKEAMDHLGESGQGIVVLHHSLLAFENWPAWKQMTGLDPALYHDYRLDVPQRYHIVSDKHPVTKGMSDFEMTDEIYLCDRITPVPGMEILVTSVDDVNMNAIAWTKSYRNSRVFCLQPGHGPSSYQNQSFRNLLHRGILWSMNCL